MRSISIIPLKTNFYYWDEIRMDGMDQSKIDYSFWAGYPDRPPRCVALCDNCERAPFKEIPHLCKKCVKCLLNESEMYAKTTVPPISTNYSTSNECNRKCGPQVCFAYTQRLNQYHQCLTHNSPTDCARTFGCSAYIGNSTRYVPPIDPSFGKDCRTCWNGDSDITRWSSLR